MGGGCSKEGEVPVLRDTDAENIASTSGLSRDEVKSAYAAFSQGHVDGKMNRDDFRCVRCTIRKVKKLENHGLDLMSNVQPGAS